MGYSKEKEDKSVQSELPITQVYVALLSVARGSRHFFLKRLADDHQWAPGKLDVLTVEVPRGQVLRMALYEHLKQQSIPLQIDEGFLGTHQVIAYYNSYEQYRDTRRLFFSSSTCGLLSATMLFQESFSVYSEQEIESLEENEFRRPIIKLALLQHARKMRLIAMGRNHDIHPFSETEYNTHDATIRPYVTEHTWSYPLLSLSP